MSYQIGDRIIWGDIALLDPTAIQTGTITKIRLHRTESLVWVDNHHKEEDCIFMAYVWPLAAKPELESIMQERAKLKKAYDDSMSLIYQLRNKVSKGEIK